MDDNLFDEDDALDYILYEECEKKDNRPGNGKSGCLGLLMLIVLPLAGLLII